MIIMAKDVFILLTYDTLLELMYKIKGFIFFPYPWSEEHKRIFSLICKNKITVPAFN